MNDAELAAVYFERFVNRTDIWFRQWIDPRGRCNYACIKPGSKRYEPISLDLIGRHLNGETTISLPAISIDHRSKWCCWDSDAADNSINGIEMVLEAIGFSPLRESVRKGRDGHLWLFFDRAISAADLIRFNAEVCRLAQVRNVRTLEFFPKSAAKLSQVRGPLGVHRKPEAENMRGWFEGVDRDLRTQLIWLKQLKPDAASRIENIVQALRLSDQQATRNTESSGANVRSSIANRVPILDLVPSELRHWNGHEWVARCPVCANEMHDRSGDNLRISADGSKFCCVYGGPAAVHSAQQIIRALL